MKSVLETSVYKWGSGCKAWVLIESDTFSLKHEILPPGAREKLHYHAKTKQQFYVLSGSATFYVDDKTIILKQHDQLFISPGEKHFVCNNETENLCLIVVSEPAIKNDRIEL